MFARFFRTLLSWLLFFSRKSFVGEWVCRDCGTAATAAPGTTPVANDTLGGTRGLTIPYSSWHDCPRLPRRGKCAEFDFQGWDGPKPRSSSFYDHASADPHPVRLLTSYGVGKVRRVEYEQPQCGDAGGSALTAPCFDMSRCAHPSRFGAGGARTLEERLSIYAYPGRATLDLQAALRSDRYRDGSKTDHLESFVVVEDPDRACLLLVHADDVSSVQQMFPDSWNLGRNHYVYGVSKPIVDNVHYDMAALGSVVMTDAQVRWGYDIPLPLPALWSSGTSASNVAPLSIYRPRKWLLSFKGSIQDTLQPYYQHRWLAAEYLHTEADVEIDVQCKHKTIWGGVVTYADYDHPTPDHFDSLMVNSTFAFCPGGSHVTSFRFSEVLSTGSIPVILPEVVTPFAPEADWSACVVRISQARIVDLPRLLRNIPRAEVRSRQKECRRLYELFFPTMAYNVSASYGKETSYQEHGGAASQNVGFLRTALKVWLLRIQKQNYADQLHATAFG